MSFVSDARRYLSDAASQFEARLGQEGYVHRLIFREGADVQEARMRPAEHVLPVDVSEKTATAWGSS
jgi:hypothetical protein